MKSKDFSFNAFGRFCLSFLILFILCWSCKKEDDPVPTTMPEMIIGRWDWYLTIIPKPYLVLSAIPGGNTAAIKFDHDSIRYYSNDSLMHTYYYELLHQPDDFVFPTGDSVWVLYFNHGSGGGYHVTLMNDTLILDDSYVDGGTDFYTRSH